METTKPLHRAQRIEAVNGHGLEFADSRLGFMLDSGIQRGLSRGVGPVRSTGNSTDKALIVCQALAENHHAVGRDFILANILGVISTAHLDDHQDLAKLAIDGYIPEPDDVVGEEGD